MNYSTARQTILNKFNRIKISKNKLMVKKNVEITNYTKTTLLSKTTNKIK